MKDRGQKKFSELTGCSVGVGILSWKAHLTLENSLKSYTQAGFKEWFDEAKIIFQEVSEEDRALAQTYGYAYVGTEQNKGIQEGHQLIYESLSTDYVLILENDNPIVVDSETGYRRLQKALELLENGSVDIMRLRHRWKFGEGFSLEKYLDYYDIEELHEQFEYGHLKEEQLVPRPLSKKIKRILRPGRAKRVAGYGLYFEKHPEKCFPEYVERLDKDIYAVSSKIATWTNQSVLLKRELYGKLLQYAQEHPSSRATNGFQDLEKPLNSKWWREQDFKIGIFDGIFTHNRFDDSWREVHHAYNSNLADKK